MRTPFATCSRSRSTASSSCRRTKRSSTSTTSRAACRCRRRSSSSTSVRRGRSPCAPSAGPMRARAARRISRRRAASSRTCKGLPLGTRGGFVVTHLFPSDGEYEVNIADMFSHIWGNDSEFENTVVVTLDGKRRLRDDGRRRGGHAPLRPGARRRDGEDQRAPEGHPLRGDGGPAQGRRHVPPPHVRRVRRPATDVRAGRRPGPRVPRAVVRGQRPVQPDGLERDAEPRHDLRLPSVARRRASELCAETHPRASSRRARIAGRSPRRTSGAARVLPRRRGDERLRGRHPQRPHGHPREPVFPLSHRDAAGRTWRPGETYRRRRRRARVEAVVLPLEHDPRRRAARSRRARRARRRARAARSRSSGC